MLNMNDLKPNSQVKSEHTQKTFYMRSAVVLLGLFLGLGSYGCSGDYRPLSSGAIDEIVVVMDSTAWDSETAEAIRAVFGGAITTLPSPEPRYRLTFRDFYTNQELERLKGLKNVLFAAPIDESSNTGSFIRSITNADVEERIRNDESFAFPLRDQWVRDQWTLILSSSGDKALAEKILLSEEALLESLRELELKRWEYEVYRRAEQTEISNMLWKEHGWRVRMQHDYVQTVDTTDVVVFRRYLPKNNRWMWAWWEDGFNTPEVINPDWIHAKRDSITSQYIRGEREDSYITTEYRRDLITSDLVLESDSLLIGFETRGTWRMTNDFMGGSFVNFTYVDPRSERVFMVEYAQFAPGIAKRRFIRQFQAMGRTFRSDATWQRSQQPQ